jgi:hypothetical protein
MTLPYERKNAVVNTERFLLDLSNPRITKGIPKEIRDRARSLLRHYPTDLYMEMAAEQAPDVFGDWKSKPKWKCPINDPDCMSNCVNYGCGN